MNLHWTLQEIATITNGKLISNNPQQMVSVFVTDSRLVSKGDGFIALKGARLDAHAFIPEVLKKDPLVIIAQENYVVPPHCPVSFVLVKDTLKALQTLAKTHRLNHALKVVAITGSNGKSTTKQMLSAICAAAGETLSTKGNLNNQFGVPFSLLEIDPKHQFGIFELGASHKGDIAETAALVVPDVAILTNVSAAHLEFFHDVDTVYHTKIELIDYLNKGGTLIYNLDNAYLARLRTDFKGNALSFGKNQNADIRLLENENLSFVYKGKTHTFPLKLAFYNQLNAAGAIAAAIALKIPMETIQQGLCAYTPMPMRMERIFKNNTQFILDCYNANPASMENAISLLEKEKGPRIAVLGDMKELGETSKKFHQLLAQQLLDHHIEYVFLAGEEMKYAYEKLANVPSIKVYYGKTPAAWLVSLRALVAQGGTCLLKASRSMNFETIFQEI